MAAITPTSIVEESSGSLKMLIATFSAIANKDTYASGLGSSVVFSHAFLTEAASTTAGGMSIVPVNSNGTFTFDVGVGADTKAGKQIIYVRG